MSRRTVSFLRHALALLLLVSLSSFSSANAALLPPPELSAWGMFMQADIVVKAVMIGLLLASVVTWTLWLVKTHELVSARRALRAPLAALAKAETLSGVRQTLAEAGPFPAAVQAAADQELRFSEGLPPEGIKERLQLALGRIEAASVARLNQGTGVLATIGATAPFVGLFGTVWGIMNSFIGIAQTQTTNLSVVAPGIAEALLATALGLVAAIPAVVLYNQYGRGLGDYRARAVDLTTAVLRLVSRDLDRGPGSRLTEVLHGNVRTA